MRRFAPWCFVAILAACGKSKEQPPADTTALTTPAPAAEPAAAPIALGDLAGKWSMRTMAADKDTTLVIYELEAGADGSSWTFNFPKRKPVPVRVQASGDSIISEAGPYESLLRKGLQVTINSVLRLQDGKLVGTAVAHYTTSGPDSVRQLRIEGTRK